MAANKEIRVAPCLQAEGVTSQNAAFFIVIAVKNSNVTLEKILIKMYSIYLRCRLLTD
jgi:hypothetical protein